MLTAWAADIDGCGVERVFDVGGVEFLDHLDAGGAVLGNVIAFYAHNDREPSAVYPEHPATLLPELPELLP